jgi:hypothetical protein
MNPQDPQSPEPTNNTGVPGPTPGSTPAAAPPPNPSAPSAAPNPSTIAPVPGQSSPMPPAKSSRKKMLISTVLPLVAFAAFITVLVVLPRFKTVTLETYSGSKFSFLAPKDYQKTEDGDSSVTFEENTKDEGTKSSIEAYREDFPEKANVSQQKDALDSVEASFKESMEDAAKKDNDTVEDYKSESTNFKGNTARIITATVKNKGSTAGRVKLVIGTSEKSLYLIAVEAHQSDRGLTNDMDKIINSFELK